MIENMEPSKSIQDKIQAEKERDKEAIAHLDKAVGWFGVERTIEILEEYNQDFEGLRG